MLLSISIYIKVGFRVCSVTLCPPRREAPVRVLRFSLMIITVTLLVLEVRGVITALLRSRVMASMVNTEAGTCTRDQKLFILI